MKILRKDILADISGTRITRIDIHAPEIAKSALPGQFVALMTSDKGERIPLTIVDSDKASGSVTLIFQEIGFTTRALGRLNPGESLHAIVGPLGHPTKITRYGSIIIIGGGVGIAEIFPVARAMKAAGNTVTAIIGSRTKDLLILEPQMKEASDMLHITADDGSYGKKCFTTDILEELLQKDRYDLVYSVGPIPMMKRSAAIATKYNTPAIVSLNAIMLDATGMCGCCRVTVAGKVRFSCVDGPEFDASSVDWDELIARSRTYDKQEKHICRLGGL